MLSKPDFDEGWRLLLAWKGKPFQAAQAEVYYDDLKWSIGERALWVATVKAWMGQEKLFPAQVELKAVAYRLRGKQRQAAPLQAPDGGDFFPACGICGVSVTWLDLVAEDGTRYQRHGIWHTAERWCVKYNGDRRKYEEAAALSLSPRRTDGEPIGTLPPVPSPSLSSNEPDDSLWVVGDAWEAE